MFVIDSVLPEKKKWIQSRRRENHKATTLFISRRYSVFYI